MLSSPVISTACFASLLMPAFGGTLLLVVDVQDCFLEASTTNGEPGSLAVPASHVIPLLNSIREQKSCLFDDVIFSQDFHPSGHISFGSTHGLDPFSHLNGLGALPLKCISPASGETADGACCPGFFLTPSAYNCNEVLCPSAGWYDQHPGIVTDNPACTECASHPEHCFDMEQAMWTDHCLQTGDSTFPPSLTKTSSDLVVQKGMNKFVDAYSAFMDNTKTLLTALNETVRSRDVDTIYIAGIATDVCVKATVQDALSDLMGNYNVFVIEDATAAVQGSQVNFNAAIEMMRDWGATITSVAEVLATECPSSGPGGDDPSDGGSDGNSMTNEAGVSSIPAPLLLGAALVAVHASL